MRKNVVKQLNTILDEYFGMSDATINKGFPWTVSYPYRSLQANVPYRGIIEHVTNK